MSEKNIASINDEYNIYLTSSDNETNTDIKNNVKKHGQYFTTDFTLQKKVYQFIKNKPDKILEPSVGRGDLVKYVKKHNKVNFDCYEIDGNIKFIINKKNIKISDFLKSEISCKYKTIIGNPPYVKQKSGVNLYIKFIE